MPKPFNTQIMGILNVTPDSYSDGGLFLSLSDAKDRITALIEESTDIIDIGAQASNANSKMIPVKTELERIEAVLEDDDILDLLKTKKTSVDTYHSEVARYALKRGVNIINDISGLRYDPTMVEVVANFDAEIVIMHSKETATHPHATAQTHSVADVYQHILDFFNQRIDYAISKGIKPNKIILDPGMGMFLSDDPQVSMDIVKRARDLKSEFKDFRILYGVSRKSFIRNLFGEEKLEQACKEIEVDLIEQGVDIIRTHNPGLLMDMLKHLYINKGTTNA